MKLRIITPLAVVVDAADVVSLRAEDASGSFGILPRAADFLTSLAVSVVEWRGTDGRQHYCAVRHGVLTVSGGEDIAIATREAVTGDDLETLDATIVNDFRAAEESERNAHLAETRLQLAAIRQIMLHLRPSGWGRPGLFS